MSAIARAALCTCVYLLVLQQRPSFRTDVNTIAVYATVRDASGHLVPNLTKDDFTVTDDGQATDIVVFERARSDCRRAHARHERQHGRQGTYVCAPPRARSLTRPWARRSRDHRAVRHRGRSQSAADGLATTRSAPGRAGGTLARRRHAALVRVARGMIAQDARARVVASCSC